MTANTAPTAETDSSPRAPHSSRSSHTPQTIALTGPWRWVISSIMALTGIFLLKQTLTVDWGVEAMLASLAIPLLIVTQAMRRRALVLDESRMLVRDGFSGDAVGACPWGMTTWQLS